MQDSYTNEQVERWCQMAQDDGKLWGAMEERERIIHLLKLEFGIGVDLDRIEMRDAIILNLIEVIRGEQK